MIIYDAGAGWRRREEKACAAPSPERTIVQVTPRGSRTGFTVQVRCERPAGHRGWHSCDQASWPTEGA